MARGRDISLRNFGITVVEIIANLQQVFGFAVEIGGTGLTKTMWSEPRRTSTFKKDFHNAIVESFISVRNTMFVAKEIIRLVFLRAVVKIEQILDLTHILNGKMVNIILQEWE